VEGLEFRAVPIETPGRRFWYYELTARLVKRAGGREGRNVRRCWMSTAENAYIEVIYRAMWGSETPAARDWWSTPPADGQRGVATDEQ
jgi:hypothetical protein